MSTQPVPPIACGYLAEPAVVGKLWAREAQLSDGWCLLPEIRSWLAVQEEKERMPKLLRLLPHKDADFSTSKFFFLTRLVTPPVYAADVVESEEDRTKRKTFIDAFVIGGEKLEESDMQYDVKPWRTTS